MERVKREENERHDGKRGRGGREREILHRPLLPPGGDSNRAERGGGEKRVVKRSGRGCADCYGNPASRIRIIMRITV